MCFHPHLLHVFLNLLSEPVVLRLKMLIWMVLCVSARSLKDHLYLK